MTPEETRLRRRVDQEVDVLLPVEVLDNLLEWRRLRRQFRDVKAQIVAREMANGATRLLADQRAASHGQISEAISFTTYYRDEALACAAALTALRGVREDQR